MSEFITPFEPGINLKEVPANEEGALQASLTPLSRVDGFDHLRVIACFAVVIGHTMGGWSYADDGWAQVEWVYRLREFGLRLFSLLTGFLMAEVAIRDSGRSALMYARSRTVRLLVPTYFWVLISVLLFQVLQPVMRGQAVSISWLKIIFPEGYLWFPVFAALGGMLGFFGLRYVPGFRLRDSCAVWLWAALSIMLFIMPWWISDLPRPFNNRSVAYLCFGVAMRLSYSLWDRLGKIPNSDKVAVVVVGGSSMGILLHPHPLWVVGVVLGLVFLGLRKGFSPLRRMGPFCVNLCFGIYLIHPFWVKAVQLIFNKVHYHPNPWSVLLLSGPVFACSALTIYGAQKGEFPSWMVPRG